MTSAKHKIQRIVTQYKIIFADEYRDFLTKETNNIDKFASVEGDGAIQRAMWDMPETLYNLIIGKLEPEELKWFNQKGSNGGQRFIMKQFKEFKVPEKI